ncbi:MAG: hypothetical protein HZC41_03585 [Chloroflexi bacterium]|nr:hypothetical protein [Chloroflexota bacterium]
MKSRLWALVLVFVLVVGMISTVSAQEMDPCLGLSSDDCAILQAADTATLNSFTASFDFNLQLTGLGTLSAMMGSADEGAPESITITANASNSPIVMNPDAADPSSALAMAMDVNGSISGLGEGTDTSGTFSFVIVDGVFYAKDPETGQWHGMTLEDAAAELGGAGLPVDPSSLLQGDMSSMGAATDPAAALAEAGLAPEDVEALMNVEGFLGQQRVADTELHGQPMATFESTVDISALLASSEFQNILMKASQSSDNPDAAQVAQIGMMLPMLVKEANVKLTRWIGVNDQLPHRMMLDVNATLDIGAMMGAAGGSDAPQMEPVVFKMTLDIELDQHNATTAPVAPEGAIMETPEASG